MNLFIIRHAEAIPRGDNGLEDEDRPLTDHGRAQARLVSEALQRQGVSLSALVTSPLTRARQTAEEMIEHWAAPAPQLHICRELGPGLRHKKLTRWLIGLGEENVGVVGHEPDLSDFVAWLIGGKRAHIDLAKGGIAAVNCEGEPAKGDGRLIWLVTPQWLGQKETAGV